MRLIIVPLFIWYLSVSQAEDTVRCFFDVTVDDVQSDDNSVSKSGNQVTWNVGLNQDNEAYATADYFEDDANTENSRTAVCTGQSLVARITRNSVGNGCPVDSGTQVDLKEATFKVFVPESKVDEAKALTSLKITVEGDIKMVIETSIKPDCRE